MSRRGMGLGLSILLWAGVAAGQQSPAGQLLKEQFAIGPVYTDTPGGVAVVVELPDGVPQPDPSNFLLALDEEKVDSASAVKSFADAERGIAWIVCADVSGTMSGKPLKTMKAALHKFAAQLSPRDKLALIKFGTEVKLLSEFQDSRKDFHEHLDRLRGGETETHFFQALLLALNIFQENEGLGFPERRRILVISDGNDEGSNVDAETVVAKAIALRIPIDAVGWRRIQDRSLDSLRDLSKRTRGVYIPAEPENLRLEDALDSLYRRLTETQTVVAYFRYPQNTEGKQSQTLAVDLKLASGVRLSQSLEESVPLVQPKPPPPPPPTPSVIKEPAQTIEPPPVRKGPPGRIWALAGGLASLLTVIILAFTSRPEPRTEPPPPETKPDTPPPPPPPPPPRVKRDTLISGFFRHPAAGQPCAVLEGQHPRGGPLSFPVEKTELRIGAAPDNDFVIPGDDYLSSHHAGLRYEQGTLLIVDLGSSNGTFVNDVRIAGSARALSPGDRITVGSCTLVLRQV